MALSVVEEDLLALVQDDKLQQLQQRVLDMPLELALEACHNIMGVIEPDVRRALFMRVRHLQNRFAGIMTVAIYLQMPQYLAFGAGTMHEGDQLTDYDLARTFILRSKSSTSGRVPGFFYPEVIGLTPNERIIALARAHVGCDPDKPKQINFFSLCGRFSYADAATTTKPGGGGTTCALFVRAVLVAAGDSRFSSRILGRPGDQADMIRYMGLDHVNWVVVGNGWISTLEAPLPVPVFLPLPIPFPIIRQPSAPRPGDVFFIRCNDTDINEPGHVGIVEDAVPGIDSMVWHTIDGGQKTPGYWSTRNVRQFTKQPRGHIWLTPWAKYANRNRTLIGWLDIAQLDGSFMKLGED